MHVGMGILFFNIEKCFDFFPYDVGQVLWKQKQKKSKFRLRARGHGLYAKPNISPM
jgi:hypothetical protein